MPFRSCDYSFSGTSRRSGAEEIEKAEREITSSIRKKECLKRKQNFNGHIIVICSLKTCTENIERNSSRCAKSFLTSLKAESFRGKLAPMTLKARFIICWFEKLMQKILLKWVVFSGGSLLYLAAACEKNGNATIHSFELDGKCVEQIRRNIVSKYRFVKIHQGDCIEEFQKIDSAIPFDFVLLDVHKHNIPQLAVKYVFPRVQGLVAIDDVVKYEFPKVSTENSTYLWFLNRGGYEYLPMASLLDQRNIIQAREGLKARIDMYKRNIPLVPKGVVFYMDGRNIPNGLLAFSNLTYEQFKFSVINPVLFNLMRQASLGVVLRGFLLRVLIIFKKPNKYLKNDIRSLIPRFIRKNH